MPIPALTTLPTIIETLEKLESSKASALQLFAQKYSGVLQLAGVGLGLGGVALLVSKRMGLGLGLAGAGVGAFLLSQWGKGAVEGSQYGTTAVTPEQAAAKARYQALYGPPTPASAPG